MSQGASPPTVMPAFARISRMTSAAYRSSNVDSSFRAGLVIQLSPVPDGGWAIFQRLRARDRRGGAPVAGLQRTCAQSPWRRHAVGSSNASARPEHPNSAEARTGEQRGGAALADG